MDAITLAVLAEQHPNFGLTLGIYTLHAKCALLFAQLDHLEEGCECCKLNKNSLCQYCSEPVTWTR